MGIDIFGTAIAYLIEAMVFLMRIVSAGLSVGSAVQTTHIVDEVNQPVSYMQPTQPSAGSTELGEQLPTEWK